MIQLKETFQTHDNKAKELLKEAFEFKNTTAPVIINDVNYWLFGDLPENIPDDYCDEDPTSMMNFQLEKMKRVLNEAGIDYPDEVIPELDDFEIKDGASEQ